MNGSHNLLVENTRKSMGVYLQESRDWNRLMMSCVSKLLLSVSITDKNKIDHVQLEEELQIFSLSSVLFNYKDLKNVVS